MANKDQKRGNRETRKPKQDKAKPSVQASPFTGSLAGQTMSKPGKKK